LGRTVRAGFGQRIELARYTVAERERIIYGLITHQCSARPMATGKRSRGRQTAA
jgi:hypothetical protein